MVTAIDTGLRVVRRSYHGNGVRRRPGEVIDVEGVRMARQLQTEGYIGPMPHDAVPVVVEDGRTFISPDTAADAGYDVIVGTGAIKE